jgi:hypothetical protein
MKCNAPNCTSAAVADSNFCAAHQPGLTGQSYRTANDHSQTRETKQSSDNEEEK